MLESSRGVPMTNSPFGGRGACSGASATDAAILGCNNTRYDPGSRVFLWSTNLLGNFQCQFSVAPTTGPVCVMQFTPDAGQKIPSQFEVYFTLPHAHASAISWQIVNTVFNGERYGARGVVQSPGASLYGLVPSRVDLSVLRFYFPGDESQSTTLPWTATDGLLAFTTESTVGTVVSDASQYLKRPLKDTVSFRGSGDVKPFPIGSVGLVLAIEVAKAGCTQ